MPHRTGPTTRPILFALTAVIGLLAACSPQPPGEVAPAEPQRIVAMADLHGDLAAARAALVMAGAIDARDRWVGGNLIVVQTGDILDRGDDEQAIIELFQRLKGEAAAAGGAVHVLNGNHELMNAYLDFRYVTPGGYADFEGTSPGGPPQPAVVSPTIDSIMATLAPHQLARANAFRPGGTFALILAQRNTALVLGETVFVHAGILPQHVDLGLDYINSEIRAWLRGDAAQPAFARGPETLIWTRLYSRDPTQASCDTLQIVLDALEVERMVVGHSVQAAGITSFCGGRLWAIDTGMAAHYGGRTEVLEIQGDVVRGLR